MSKIRPIYIYVRGGLGNQMSFLAEGLTLAVHTKRKLWLDMRKAGSTNNLSQANDSIEDYKFMPEAEIKFINNYSTRKEKIICNLLYVINLSFFSFGFHKLSKYQQFKLFSFVNPRDHFEGNSIINILSNTPFFQSVDLQYPSKFYLELVETMLTKKILCIHYRHGDYESWHHGRYLIQPDRYIKQIYYLLEVHKKLESQVWVFTDDVLNFQSIFKSTINTKIISCDKLRPSEELMLLSKAYCIIGSNSTFSFWACVFNKRPNSVWVPVDSLALPGWNKYL